MTGTAPLLAMRGICKRFGPVQANDKVDLTLHRGDILGLLGENGAGKTTLMNVLFGSYAPDAGTIEIDGRPARIHDSADAIALGCEVAASGDTGVVRIDADLGFQTRAGQIGRAHV